MGRYQGDDFAWFRVASLRSGPDRVLDREQLEIMERRGRTVPESYAMPIGAVVLRCRTAVGELELAMRARHSHRVSVLAGVSPAAAAARLASA